MIKSHSSDNHQIKEDQRASNHPRSISWLEILLFLAIVALVLSLLYTYEQEVIHFVDLLIAQIPRHDSLKMIHGEKADIRSDLIIADIYSIPDELLDEDDRLTPNYWKRWPIVPSATYTVAKIYQRGQSLRNDPRAFSVIGDCQSEPAVFFGIFATDRYSLSEDYAHLQTAIDNFADSFSRDFVTVKNGLSVASTFSPMWSDPERCLSAETPIECEYRLHQPSFMIISLGSNWTANGSGTHTDYLLDIVEFAVEHGVVPILATKADNVEGDHSINRSIAQIAYDYDLPLWNFWRSVQHLPNGGIDDQREIVYLTPIAWDIRSFTGLQALYTVWSGLQIDQ